MHHSCHTWSSHATYERVMAHTPGPMTSAYRQSASACVNEHQYNRSSHVWMSHVVHEWVMSRMNESRRTWQALRNVVRDNAYVNLCERERERETMPMWICACARLYTNHVIYGWVISYMHEPSDIWTRRTRHNTHDRLGEICYGVATISRLLKTIGLFCRTSSRF